MNQAVWSTIEGLKSSLTIGPVGELQNHNYLIYHFATLADADNYMSFLYAIQPSLIPPTTSRCGYTGYFLAGSVKMIVSSVYDKCHYSFPTDSNVQNSDGALSEVTAHEAGHAFDFALAADSSQPNQPTSATTAFLNLVNSDEGQAAINSANPCTIFGLATTSQLELNIGADAETPVCTNTNQLNPIYAGKTNMQLLQLKVPYFLYPPTLPKYSDFWAQSFVLKSGKEGSEVLPITDNVFRYIKSIGCAANAVQYWYDLVAPPNHNAPIDYPSGCNAETGLWNH